MVADVGVYKMKPSAYLLIAVFACGCLPLADDTKLYEDSEVKATYEKLVDHRDDGLLNIVPAGETKLLSEIFRMLGFDPKRLGKPRVEGMNMVNFHVWQVSSGYQLSIMVANNDPDNKNKEMLKLKGYGVRLQPKQERQPGGGEERR